MPFIHFKAITAERLAAGTAIVIILLSIVSFWALTNGDTGTPVPKAVLWHALPAATGQQAAEATMQVGAPAPDFTLVDTGGNAVNLQARRGRPVVLYFWASWCSFCRDDMPKLQQCYDAHKDAGLQILAINLLEQADHVASFGRQLKLTYPLLLDSQGQVSRQYLIKATPTYVFIDKDGVVASQLVGRPREVVFEANLAQILDAGAAEQ